MNRPHLIRWLRTAVSALCLAMFVGVMFLWVRSYWWCDSATQQGKIQKYRVISCRGRIGVAWIPLKDSTNRPWVDPFGKDVFPVEWESRQIVSRGDYLLKDGHVIVFGRTDVSSPGRVWAAGFPIDFAVSYWQMALPFAIGICVSSFPWIRQLRWRFSLRTLLIVTTLVAVVLGFVVWAVR